HRYAPPRTPPSFPTRRSSDLHSAAKSFDGRVQPEARPAVQAHGDPHRLSRHPGIAAVRYQDEEEADADDPAGGRRLECVELRLEIGRAHVLTPDTSLSRMPSS